MSHMTNPTLEQGKSTRSKTERTCDVQSTTPISPVPALLGGGGGREIEKEVRPRKKEGMEGKGVLRTGFISHHATLI